MNKITCDRCGAECSKLYHLISSTRMKDGWIDTDSISRFLRWELCRKCAMQLASWMKGE